MHPISKIYFGDGTNGFPSFTVLFHTGVYETYGYIVKQLGTNKFIVSDETDKYTCFLSSDGNISEGLMTIIVNKIVNGVTSGTEERVIKFLGSRKVLTNQGNTYKITLNNSLVPSSDPGNYAENDPYVLGKSVGENVWRFPDTNIPIRRNISDYWLRY